MLKGRDWAESMEILESWAAALASGAVYGFGLSRLMFAFSPPRRDPDFYLAGIFDSDPALHGRTVMGFDILPPKAAPLAGGKIVVFCADYAAVRQELSSLGLREGHDFIGRRDYWTLMSYYRYGTFFVSRNLAHLVTSRCTLRCRDCGARVPYGPAPAHRPLEELTAALDSFFSVIDEAAVLHLLGGEPLMHPGLADLLRHVGQNYRSRISSVGIVTNGTLEPSAELLGLCRRWDVKVEISDYSDAGIPGYPEQLAAIVRAMTAAGLAPHRMRREAWGRGPLDGSEAAALGAFDDQGFRRHYGACLDQCCYVTAEGLLGRCSRASTKFPDAVDLKAYDLKDPDGRLKLLAALLGYEERGYLPACLNCRGQSFPAEIVPRAVQLPGGKP